MGSELRGEGRRRGGWEFRPKGFISGGLRLAGSVRGLHGTFTRGGLGVRRKFARDSFEADEDEMKSGRRRTAGHACTLEQTATKR